MIKKLLFLSLALCLLAAGAEAFRSRGSGGVVSGGGGGPTATSLVSIGDSITAFGPPTGYPYLLSVDKSLTLTNRAIGTYMTCWMGEDEVFPNEDPQLTGTPIYTIMAGTNDEVNHGISPGSPGPVMSGYEGLYSNCLMAMASWLATPNTAKVIPSTCPHTGTWTTATDQFRPNQAVVNNGLGDTITCTISVVNGVIYVWFRTAYDGFYSIDGGSNVAFSFPYALTSNSAINVLRVTGLTNGSHTIRITNNYGGGGIVMGPVGTGTASSCCRVMLSNIIREQADANAARNQTYSDLAVSAAAAMVSDGLNVVAVDARSYVNTTTDMVDTLHPNATGLRHIADAFEAVWGGGSILPQSITGVSPSSGSFASGSGSANAVVFTATATMSPTSPAFSGTWSISGTDAGKFKINASTGVLTVCNTAPSCTDLASGSYSINVIATAVGLTGSPSTQAVTITGVSQSISGISPSTGSFTAASSSANALVFTATATMSPISPAFAGVWTIGGTDAGKFAINASTGAVTVCNTKPSCTDITTPGTYNVTVTATASGITGSPATQAVTITGGAVGFLTTATFKEISGTNQAANWPKKFGQGFKRGDIPTGFHPEVRVASGLTCNGALLPYQWDEIATRTENGQDGSWRHAVGSVRLPATNANQYVSVAICKAAGSYSTTAASVDLTTLCASHDFMLDLSDVSNQDLSTRGTGATRFRVCDNIANTGRDAPEKVADGPVRQSWVVRGMQRYGTGGTYTGAYDPMLYELAYIDLYPDPAAPTTIYKTALMLKTANSWMQVAAGTAGTAATAPGASTLCNGSPCPVGLANDPQVVIYQPYLHDGATAMIDYDNIFSATIDPAVPTRTVDVASTTAPGIGATGVMIATPGTVDGIYYGTIVTNQTNPGSIPANCAVTDPYISGSNYGLSCTTVAGSRGNGVQIGDTLRFATMFVQTNSDPSGAMADSRNAYFSSPKSTQAHPYYAGSCWRYSTSGTPPSGMTSGLIYYAAPVNINYRTTAADRFQLGNSVDILPGKYPAPWLMIPTTAGTGLQTLSYRVCQHHFSAWYAATPDARELWTGSATTEPYEIAPDQEGNAGTAERDYWELTGLIPPWKIQDVNYWETNYPFMSSAGRALAMIEPFGTGSYWPMGVTMGSGGSGGGARSDIGITTEWTARWWYKPLVDRVKWTTMFSLDGDAYPATHNLNEATGLIPTVTNGPPVGTAGGGGVPFTGLGALYPHYANPLQSGYFNNVAEPLSAIPLGGHYTYPGHPYIMWFGPYGTGIKPDHQAAYSFLTFTVWGRRANLESNHMEANRNWTITFDMLHGPSSENDPSGPSFRIPPGSGGTHAGETFYRMQYNSILAQGPRSAAWQERAIVMASGLGADNNKLRGYFQANLKEQDNYWVALSEFKDCVTPGVPIPGLWSNNQSATVNIAANQGFMNMYNVFAHTLLVNINNSPSARSRLNGAFLTAAQSMAGTSGWPASTPPIYSGSFFAQVVPDLGIPSSGRCAGGRYTASASDYASAEQNVIIDTSNGKIHTFKVGPGDNQTFSFTPGDLIKNFGSTDVNAQALDITTGLPINSSVPIAGPNEIPHASFACIVNIDNTLHVFQVALPSPTCATPGAAITSFTGMTDVGFITCYPPPYANTLAINSGGVGGVGIPTGVAHFGMNTATTWFCSENLSFRVQSATFAGVNPGYVWWTRQGFGISLAAGFSAYAPYFAQALTTGININTGGDGSSSNAAFDIDETRVQP